MSPATIVLMSDFGECNGTVSMVGVVKGVDPTLSVYTLTHEVPRFDVKTASRLLSDQLSSWPKGTVFVCAVDPAVGTRQRVLAVETCDGYGIVAPDNGCITDVERAHGLATVRDLHELHTAYAASEQSGLYHGRNLAYCAAQLASGKTPFLDAGESILIEELVRI